MRNSGDLGATWRLRRLIRERRPEVLQLHTGHAVSIGARAARFAGSPRPKVIVHRHVGYSPDRHAWPLNLHRVKFTWGVDRVICVAQAVKDRMAAGGIPAQHLAVVPNAIDPDLPPPDVEAIEALRRRAGVGPDEQLLGAVGALTPEKGHADLLQAYALLDPARRGLRLAIAGAGPLRDALGAEALRLGVEDRVAFLGFVDDVPSFLRALDLFVFPSHEEGAPVTVLEAMLAGVPVLATTAGGVPEMIRDGVDGRLVPPRDVAALASACADLLDEPDVRAALAESAATRVRDAFTAERSARAVLAVYRDLQGAP